MIAYVDSSVLGRAYLPDEYGHAEARGLLEGSDLALVTGTWTRIEVSGTLVGAGRHGRGDVRALLRQLDADLGPAGRVSLLSAPQAEIEEGALELVRRHGVRSLDAWHLALARLTLRDLAGAGEPVAFATRDAAQATVARELGFEPL